MDQPKRSRMEFIVSIFIYFYDISLESVVEYWSWLFLFFPITAIGLRINHSRYERASNFHLITFLKRADWQGGGIMLNFEKEAPDSAAKKVASLR